MLRSVFCFDSHQMVFFATRTNRICRRLTTDNCLQVIARKSFPLQRWKRHQCHPSVLQWTWDAIVGVFLLKIFHKGSKKRNGYDGYGFCISGSWFVVILVYLWICISICALIYVLCEKKYIYIYILDPPRVWNLSPLSTKNRPRGWNLTPVEGLVNRMIPTDINWLFPDKVNNEEPAAGSSEEYIYCMYSICCNFMEFFHVSWLCESVVSFRGYLKFQGDTKPSPGLDFDVLLGNKSIITSKQACQIKNICCFLAVIKHTMDSRHTLTIAITQMLEYVPK